jgi:surface antigen
VIPKFSVKLSPQKYLLHSQEKYTVKSCFHRPSLFLIALALSLISFNSYALDLNLDLDLNMTQQSALTELSDSDWKILKTKAREVLKTSFDGENNVWKNDETGNSGVIKVLSTHTENDSFCRNTQFINTANNITSTTVVMLCATEDGKWSEETPRVTTTDSTTDLSNSSSNSDMFNENQTSGSTEITAKTLGQTSEFCQNLAREIENLKGKPIRRNAAREQHKAECQR